MTIPDDQLQQLIGSAVDSSQLRQFDADTIAELASRSASRRRRLTLASAGAVAVVAAAAATVVGLTEGQPSPVAQPTAPADAPRGGPPCPGPQVTVPGVTLDKVVTLKSTTVGVPITVEAILQSSGNSRVLQGELVVAKPDTTPVGGNAADVPANAATRPENQVARGDAVVDVVPAGQKLTVTFQPTASGTYPVYYVSRFRTADDCAGPAPVAGTPIETATYGLMQLGEIAVK